MINYLVINLLIIIFPLLFSFEKRIRYYTHFRSLFPAIFMVGTYYIIWDAVATARGDWGFNHEYVMDFNFAGLPLEEVLFFVTAPYSCIFIYEALLLSLRDRELTVNPKLFIIPAVILAAGGVLFLHQNYTSAVLFSCALFFIMAIFILPSMLKSRAYWLYIIIVFIPFFVMNYLLTSIPIVLYNSDAIWKARVTTIPLEDFFYNFGMLSFYLMIYLSFKKRVENGSRT
ncbi:MAG: lycopene cyclase domain-containing protein [Thermoplasmata archaeon]|nr:MAG: lycopene cyclase domain-containing protein [Thermoplasmata archaeon]